MNQIEPEKRIGSRQRFIATTMFQFMFNQGQALLLSWLRFLRPLNRRGAAAARPHKDCGLWPPTLQIRDFEQSSPRKWPRMPHFDGRSVSAFSPRSVMCPQMVCLQGQRLASAIRDQARANATNLPKTVRGRKPFPLTSRPRNRIIFRTESAIRYPRAGIITRFESISCRAPARNVPGYAFF